MNNHIDNNLFNDGSRMKENHFQINIWNIDLNFC